MEQKKLKVLFYCKNKDNPAYKQQLRILNKTSTFPDELLSLGGISKKVEMRPDWAEQYTEAWSLTVTPEPDATIEMLINLIDVTTKEVEASMGITDLLYKISWI